MVPRAVSTLGAYDIRGQNPEPAHTLSIAIDNADASYDVSTT